MISDCGSHTFKCFRIRPMTGGLPVRGHGPEADLERAGDKAAELTVIPATVTKERPEELW
jgi:hypothetical protein